MQVRRTLKVGSVVVVLGAGLAAWQFLGNSGAQARASAQAETTAELESHYAFSGGEAGRAAVQEAIEAATQEMNPLIRGIAKRRLIDANKVIDELGFSVSGDPLVASYVQGRVIEAPADGSTIRWVDQYGEKIKVSLRYSDGKLVQQMSGSKGKRRNVYRFSGDGKTMTMSVKIESGMLPQPVEYKVAYRKRS